MVASDRLPTELFYDILTFVLSDYFHECVVEKPDWDAVTTLFQVSRPFQAVTRKLVSQTFCIGISESTGRLKFSPLSSLTWLDYPIRLQMFRADWLEEPPFIQSYREYLGYRSLRHRIMDSRSLEHCVLDKDAVDFLLDSKTFALVFRSSLKRCDKIVPISMGSRLRSQLLEEAWLLKSIKSLAKAVVFLERFVSYVETCDDVVEGGCCSHVKLLYAVKVTMQLVLSIGSGRLQLGRRSLCAVSPSHASIVMPWLVSTYYTVIPLLRRLANPPRLNCSIAASAASEAALVLEKCRIRSL